MLVLVVILLLAGFVFLVPVVGQTKTLWAKWGTLENGVDQSVEGCPPGATCAGVLLGFNVHYVASLAYYFWKLGAYSLQGSIDASANGNAVQYSIQGGYTYLFATGNNPCFTGYVCLSNVTRVIVMNTTASSAASVSGTATTTG